MPNQQIEIFPWNDSFKVGMSEIDEQHQELVKLLNEVAGRITLECSATDAGQLIQRLMDYAVYHFDTEEKYWLQKLPDSDETRLHRQSHNHFIRHVNELKDNIAVTKSDKWIEELMSFLTSWLASHILENDKEMAFLVDAVDAGKTMPEAKQWAKQQMNGVLKTAVDIVLGAYKNLSANAIRLMREIKQKNNAYEQLAESEHRLNEAMSYAQIGQWSFPYDGDVAQWSPQMYQLFGLPDNAIPGPKSLCSIMRDDHQSIFTGSMKDSFETGKEHRVEYQIVRPSDGEQRWIECRGKVVSETDGTRLKITGFVQDVTERKLFEERITHLAYYDSLTELPNRRFLIETLGKRLNNNAEQYKAILYIDIDEFKSVNDSHGHEYGDELLQQVSHRIQQSIGRECFLSRLGGDEFVVITEELSILEREARSKVKSLADVILRVLSLPYNINNRVFHNSASIGISIFNDDKRTASELMTEADIAMFQAKSSGKSNACFYDARVQNEITQRIVLENELRNALDEDQFELYYQPQIDNENNLTGLEALLRWHHPEKGMLSPNYFISLAEDTGLIVPIGSWVLREAVKQLKTWRSSCDYKNVTVSVNVSYQQFRHPDFLNEVRRLVHENVIEPGALKLELTESMLVDDIEHMVLQMQTLKEMGVILSLDDFGTGYSSLQYLKKLPISQLKIDKSFVGGVESDVSSQSIVKTIILMAQSLGIELIAEGVETLEQRNYLLEHGCTAYQGYLYSRPLSSKDLSGFHVRKTVNPRV